MNPGVTVLPFKSTTRVFSPMWGLTSSSEPTARSLPSATANAVALEFAASTVSTFALRTTSSADWAHSDDTLHDRARAKIPVSRAHRRLFLRNPIPGLLVDDLIITGILCLRGISQGTCTKRL